MEKTPVLHHHEPVAESIPAIDGRVLRGMRTRQAIIQATRELFLRDPREPTLVDIARTAGVSRRIVLKHFGDMGGIINALMDSVRDELLARYATVDISASRDDRVATYIDLRAEICETYGPLWWLAVRMARHTSAIRAMLQEGREDVRSLAARIFDTDLQGLPRASRRDLTDELAMLGDTSNWRYLRLACGRSQEETKAILRRAVRRVLSL